MAKITIDLGSHAAQSCLALLYSSGYNDGLRRAVGRAEKGQGEAMHIAVSLLECLAKELEAAGGK